VKIAAAVVVETATAAADAVVLVAARATKFPFATFSDSL
jgi:hypothetical protein